MDGVTVTPERPEGVRAPAPPPPPPHGRLRRDSDRALLGGVCSGIANRLAIDPLVVRLAFVAAAVAGGWGIVLYLLGWGFIPAEQGQGRPPVRRLTVGRRGWQVAIGIGFMVLAVMLLARDSGLWFSDALVWPVVLAARGAAPIWRPSQPAPGPPPARGGRGVRASRVAGRRPSPPPPSRRSWSACGWPPRRRAARSSRARGRA